MRALSKHFPSGVAKCWWNLWFLKHCFVPPNVISHVFLAEEVFLIIHLNSQNISSSFEEGFAFAGREGCPSAS